MVRGLAEPGGRSPLPLTPPWACERGVERTKAELWLSGLLTCHVLTWPGSPRSLVAQHLARRRP